jgi:hypothetical protein
MRVDYTLPSIQPDALPDLATATGETGQSFREQLRTPSVQLPVNWEQEMRLDARPFTGTYIGPPPRLHNMEVSDPEVERGRWRNMLARHDSALDPLNPASSEPSQQPVRSMLNLLLDMQDMEDSIVAQNVAVTRG